MRGARTLGIVQVLPHKDCAPPSDSPPCPRTCRQRQPASAWQAAEAWLHCLRGFSPGLDLGSGRRDWGCWGKHPVKGLMACGGWGGRRLGTVPAGGQGKWVPPTGRPYPAVSLAVPLLGSQRPAVHPLLLVSQGGSGVQGSLSRTLLFGSAVPTSSPSSHVLHAHACLPSACSCDVLVTSV